MITRADIEKRLNLHVLTLVLCGRAANEGDIKQAKGLLYDAVEKLLNEKHPG